jgi:hypothetical protein
MIKVILISLSRRGNERKGERRKEKGGMMCLGRWGWGWGWARSQGHYGLWL